MAASLANRRDFGAGIPRLELGGTEGSSRSADKKRYEDQQQSRREAVRRILAGEAVAAVAADLGRSKPWMRTRVDRYEPVGESWASSRSRAPRTASIRNEEADRLARAQGATAARKRAFGVRPER